MKERPFTALVNALRAKGYRYQDLVNRSGEARSSAWFNNLVNGSTPWIVAPPNPETWERLATLFGITEQHLSEAIAVEWFGAASGSDLEPEVRAVADVVARLSVEDREYVARLAERLAQPVKTLTDILDEPLPSFDDFSIGDEDGDSEGPR
ncbi:hypothetical protein [Cellulomonas terrae]|uniref:hypothetical protein n=1 Tax=Cellulomonas terrae TaxID=311234 RepID=UPI00164996F6|nr:hypothetical protein [Cellulomonas terrae]